MKTLITLITFCLISPFLHAQITKDSRVVYVNTSFFLDTEMIDSWDPGSLTSNETKKYLEFQKRLKHRCIDLVLEKSNEFLIEKGAQVQALETAGEFGMMALTEGYPTMVFPKKALKKKGAKLDLGDYFISYHISFTRPLAKPSLKGYSPDFELEVKLFSQAGEKIKSYKVNHASEKKMGVVTGRTAEDKNYFSRTDFDSIDWIMENFGPALEKAISDALPQLYN